MLRLKFYLPLLLLATAFFSCEEDSLTGDAAASAIPSETSEADDFFEDDDELVFDADLQIDNDAIFRKLGYGDELTEEKSRRHPVVYTLSNEVSGNEVIQFNAAADGTLTEVARFPTGGTGTGEGLGNQGALAIARTPGSRVLWAVDPGSNSIAIFFVFGDGSLELLDTQETRGNRPVSITVRGDVAFVAFAGSDNVEGFRRGALFGDIRPVGDLYPLSGTGTAPAQISFTNSGRNIVVTEKATNIITTFTVAGNATLSEPNFTPSAGITPFGFANARGGSRIIVSEAAQGAAGEATVSTYRVTRRRGVRLLGKTLQLGATASCWVAFDRRSDQAFVTNTGSDDISSLRFDRETRTTSISNGGATTPALSAPLDAGLDRRGNYLYVLATGTDALLTYEVAGDGTLLQIDTDGGLPDRATGVAVFR